MYCKKCGKLISDDSEFCSYCGTRQTLLGNSNDKRLIIPEGSLYCSFCGEVKTQNHFNISLDQEYHECDGCSKRKKYVLFITIFVTVVLDILVIILMEADITAILGFIMTLGIIPGLILYFTIDGVLSITPLRISLSNKRKKYLRELKDSNGNPVVVPIVRTAFEQKYKLITGHYRSRDIPLDNFRCPICGQLHSISMSNEVVYDSDQNSRLIGTWFGTKRVVTTTNYRYRTCSKCFKLKDVENKLFLSFGLLGMIAAPVTNGLINGYTFWSVVVMVIVGLFAGFIVGFVIRLPYRLFVLLLTKKNLFVNYEKVAHYGAVMPAEQEC